MENMNVFAVKLLPKTEYIASGHRACQGCGEILAVRMVQKAFGRNTVVASATGCMEIISSPYPETAWKVPWLHVAFENAAAVASGIEAGFKARMRKGLMEKKRIIVVGMGGDGGTVDIGLQALSGAMERGHDMVYVCYDNEAYMNTGIQRSSSTPYGAMTTTSPPGKLSVGQKTQKKNVPEIMVAHDIPYVATACPSFPMDLYEKAKKAADVKGPAYLHVFSVCPTGWRSKPEETVMLGRLAVDTGIFPLYEVEDGKYKITYEPLERRPVKDYLERQGRFRHLTDVDIEVIQKNVEKGLNRLAAKVRETNV